MTSSRVRRGRNVDRAQLERARLAIGAALDGDHAKRAHRVVARAFEHQVAVAGERDRVVIALREAAIRGTLTMTISRAEQERLRAAGYRLKIDRLLPEVVNELDMSGDFELALIELPVDVQGVS